MVLRYLLLLICLTVPLGITLLMGYFAGPPPLFLLNELENDLTQHVHGQDKAIEKLMTVVSELQYNRTSGPHLIFLLGGPGVGKTLVKDIMKQNLFCNNIKYDFWSYNSIFSNTTFTLCGNINNKFIIFAEDKIKNFKSFINDENDVTIARYYSSSYDFPKDFGTRGFLRVVSGEIVSSEDLKRFTCASDYENFVKDAARKLKAYMSRHVPNFDFHVITFKPLKKKSIFHCLSNLEVKLGTGDYSITYINSDRDWYTYALRANEDQYILKRGCKSLQYIKNERIYPYDD